MLDPTPEHPSPSAGAEAGSRRPASRSPATRSRPLPGPAELRALVPRRPALAARITRARREIRDVLHGRDPRRLIVVVGPCSLHDRGSALEYAARLAEPARRHRAELVVVMRAYVEKPRSGYAWKGLLNDPDLDGRGDLERGLALARELLCGIGELGLPCAAEVLDPLAADYLQDLLAWSAIGARTVESQPHRELASGLPMPVGMKNTTAGDVDAAVSAALVAQRPHTRLGTDDAGRLCQLRTRGNPDAHVVLRGGASGCNHEPKAVREAARRAGALALVRPLLVDCSHGNSGKDHERQAEACRAVLAQTQRTADSGIAGLLLESHLAPGRQAWQPGLPRPAPDRSITDACIGWEETCALLEAAAAAVARRRDGSRGSRRIVSRERR